MSLSMKASITDVAFNCMSRHKKEVEFTKLWAEVAKAAKIPEEQMSKKKKQLYSALMMDSRFTALEGNKWDLCSRRKFDEIHAKKDLLEDVDDENDEIEEDENGTSEKADEEY